MHLQNILFVKVKVWFTVITVTMTDIDKGSPSYEFENHFCENIERTGRADNSCRHKFANPWWDRQMVTQGRFLAIVGIVVVGVTQKPVCHVLWLVIQDWYWSQSAPS